ncbi:MAG: DUF4926 domain-containing protein [Hyphomonadaceae bacterium]
MTGHIAEHERAVVTRDFPELGLVAGDVGVVVHIHRAAGGGEPVGYMLELFSLDGESLREESLPADAVRSVTANDLMHARPVAAE